jgi:hypothetical protein
VQSFYPKLFFFKESETLVNQNQSLKSEIHKLEREKKRLIDVLASHESSCPKRQKTEMLQQNHHQVFNVFIIHFYFQ